MAIDLSVEMPRIRQEVGTRVLVILAENYFIPKYTAKTDKKAVGQKPSVLEQFTAEHSLEDNLPDSFNFDSLDSLEFVSCLEDEFRIAIPDGEIPRFSTIRSILEYVDRHAPKDYKPSQFAPIIMR